MKPGAPAHLIHNLGDERNTICIVSWQAPNTLGRRLVEGESRVRIFGEEYKVRAEVATVNGLSSHAGQGFLIESSEQTKGNDLRAISSFTAMKTCADAHGSAQR